MLLIAAVQLMIYFLKCYMTIILKWYFESIFIQKRLCWPSFWNNFHFEIGSAQSLKAILYAPRFEMIYDFHFEMRAVKFSYTKLFWLAKEMPRRSGARITSLSDNLHIPYNKKYLPAKSVAFQLLPKECKYMYGTCC